MNQTIHLGYEVGTGEPVSIPLGHLCVTGQTQSSGKTTTLEALITRSGRQAIAFVTKRGEGAFSGDFSTTSTTSWMLKPFFTHRADWQFVSDILGAVLSEKLKFQRPWIIKVCRGSKNLRDVHAKVKREMAGDKAKKIRPATGMSEGVYTELDAYFDLLIPEIEALPYSTELNLQPGLNVMDLSEYSTALQMLVISSTLERIYKTMRGVIVVIPEAWEFIPNNRSSPAKSAAITLARKGAVLQNFLFLDSQDLASIDTEVRRACTIWILGVQREQNEVKRLLSHIPSGTKKPKADDIMHLERGQFFVCHGREVTKVYVQPAWMSSDNANAIAQGLVPQGEELFKAMSPHNHPGAWRAQPERYNRELESLGSWPIQIMEAGMDEQARREYEDRINDQGRTITDLRNQLEEATKQISEMRKSLPPYVPVEAEPVSRLPNNDLRDRELLAIAEKYSGPLLDRVFADPRIPPHPFTLNDGQVLVPEDAVQVILDRVFADPRMPRGGVVQVEAKEVVLREFQQREVNRIVKDCESFDAWERDVLRFMSARGSRAKMAEIFRGVGREGSGPQYTPLANQVKALATAGWLRADQGWYYSAIDVIVAKRLETFNASKEDVDAVVDQVLLRLKPT